MLKKVLGKFKKYHFQMLLSWKSKFWMCASNPFLKFTIHSTFLGGPQFRDIWNSRNFFVSFRQKVIGSCFWVNF